jgi:hypothetical protein
MAGMSIWTALSAASSALSAVQALRQGQSQSAMYELQGEMALANAEREAVNAELQANEVLKNLQRTNAAAIARGFAGGVSGFSGSAKLIQEVNEKFAGRDFKNLQVAAKEKRSFGQIQSMMFQEAADAAVESSVFDALSTAASGVMTAYKFQTGGAPEAVSGYQGYANQVTQYGTKPGLLGGNMALPGYMKSPYNIG